MELFLTEQPVELKQFLNVNKIILNDCDVYDKDTDELVICFKKNVIPKELYNIDPKLIKHASAYSNNRGAAAGITNVKDLQKGMEHWKNYPVEVIDKHGNPLPDDHKEITSWIRMKDGTINKRKRSNQVMSNSVGGYDQSNIYPCRLTNWTRKNLQAYESIFPLSKYISDLYFQYAPDKWLRQYDKYSKSPPEFTIPDTNFSTLTINMNFRTACHKDAGDCKDGLTAFTIKDIDGFKGSELCFPTYNIAFDVREEDLVLFNPHKIHCNNPLTKKGRMSFVFYLREKMDMCS